VAELSKDRPLSPRQREVQKEARRKIEGYIDVLTGGDWRGAFEDSLYVRPDKGIFDYSIPPGNISISFKRRDESTLIADRIIRYEGKRYPERFIGSVLPDGRIGLTSTQDTDVLSGVINPRAGTISFLFYDVGEDLSSLGSQNAIGSMIFADVSGL
jgi:hypothetical protein